MEHERKTTIL